MTAPIVYANYGRHEDYVTLDRLGINVTDKLVLTRFGKLFRGRKIINAQRMGALGVIIYNDPQEYGPPGFVEQLLRWKATEVNRRLLEEKPTRAVMSFPTSTTCRQVQHRGETLSTPSWPRGTS